MVVERFKQIDIDTLPISDYNKVYLHRIKNSVDYYADIYNHCIDIALDNVKKPVGEVVMVDYGGGHGLLSMIAKERGFGKVVYIDTNPYSVETLHHLSKIIQVKPDEILLGDSSKLKQWSNDTNQRVDVLLGMDVIEHIYCLDDFFSDITKLSSKLYALFTTGSNPYNKRVVKRLHKVMIEDEEKYYELRKDYIQTLCPDYSEKELDYWAASTRGLIYEDIKNAVASESINILADLYNTCDPRTGSWTERILPLEDYSQLSEQYGYDMHYQLGYYNVHQKGLKGIMARFLNKMIAGPWDKNIAPWVILEMIKCENI